MAIGLFAVKIFGHRSQVVELTLTLSVIGWATAYEPRSKKYGDDEKVVACDERTIPGVESKYSFEDTLSEGSATHF